MKRGTRDVVRAFLDELGTVPFTEDEPLYRIGRRQLLAEMVLAEVRDDDLEGMALRSLGEVAREQCLSPTDREVVGRFIAARRSHLDVVTGSYFGVGRVVNPDRLAWLGDGKAAVAHDCLSGDVPARWRGEPDGSGGQFTGLTHSAEQQPV